MLQCMVYLKVSPHKRIDKHGYTPKECTQKATTDAYEMIMSSDDGEDDNASIAYSPEVTLAAIKINNPAWGIAL